MITGQIAKICHEANKAYCQTLGDHSQASWELSPEWQRNSAIAGVEMFKNNPEATSEDSHVSWMAQKIADGWTHGPKKDPVLKQHPCMVPYCELPEDQRLKDKLFSSIAKALI